MSLSNISKLLKFYEPPCRDSNYNDAGFYSLEQLATKGFSTYSSDLSVEDANTNISGHLSTIREASAVLSRKMEMHADLFMSRWKKYSRVKRENLLRAIAPGIAPDPRHTIQYVDFIPEHLQNRAHDPSTRQQLLLPWLDIETLKTHPHILFALLHYRIHHPPQAWVAFDIEQLNLGWRLMHFKVHFARIGVIVHGPQYGELTDWDCSSAHRGDILGFPKAQLLFEAQAYLMATLRDLVLQVLSGVDDGTPIRTSKWRELTATSNYRLTNGIELWSPFIFSAFSPPPTLDLRRIISLANTRLSTIGDHLWQLQCNPVWMLHQTKRFIGTRANEDEERVRRVRFFLAHLISEVFSYIIWRWVEIECKKAEDLQQQFREAIRPGQPLLQEYEKAIGELELLLQFANDRTTTNLVRDSFAGDAMSHMATFDPVSQRGDIHIDDSFVVEKWDSKDPLVWCLLRMIRRRNYTDCVFEHAVTIRCFQHLSVSDSQVKSRISEFLCKWVADFSAFSEILSLLRSGRPKAQCATLEAVMDSGHRGEWQLLRRSPETKTHLYDSAVRYLSEISLEDKSPQQSRVTLAALGKFWSSLHELLSTSFEKDHGIPKDEAQQMLQVIARTQSAEYQQLVLAEEAEILAESKRRTTLRETMETVVMEEPRKKKIKTRPQEKKEADVAISEDVTEGRVKTLEPSPTPALIRATKRALDAIRFMFPTNPEEASVSLQWADFVRVMGDMGFVAREGGGSAVSFEADGQGKIVFHRPHPESKISPVMLHTMGARMNKWFGWKRESFALDEA